MKICKNCGGIAEWNSYYGGVTCTRCGYVEKPKQTHYDLLIRKSPEEMAEWIERIRVMCANDICGRACPLKEICYSRAEEPTEALDWLKREVEEGET